ncbi:alpha/beta fold hydrolase [Sphingomonas sp. ID0503]|uniref:alpha/beta fold hydrolase n=1 Tax=Sphingomonas sp. ID0503 TaxID=3399691 RepID=UPI003AFACCC4
MQLSRRQALAGLLTALPATSAIARAPDWTPPAPDQELRVPVRGGRIYVRVNGDLTAPRAPVVLIHGGPGSNHGYLTACLPLADERAVIVYDQLDCGRSDHPSDPADWTAKRFVSEVDAIRAALDLRRLHIVGNSWGGTIALEYATPPRRAEEPDAQPAKREEYLSRNVTLAGMARATAGYVSGAGLPATCTTWEPLPAAGSA